MLHETELIGSVAVGFMAAFVFGLVAVRLRLPLIVGYLLAGVAVGTFTPGFVADTHLASGAPIWNATGVSVWFHGRTDRASWRSPWRMACRPCGSLSSERKIGLRTTR